MIHSDHGKIPPNQWTPLLWRPKCLRLGFSPFTVREAHMHTSSADNRVLHAHVIEVLPQMGLAWVLSEDQHEWALSGALPGLNLQQLKPGQQLTITLRTQHGMELPSACH